MDDIKTGMFTISTAFSDFYQTWQEELAKEDLKRRARAACERVQRDGVPYVTCLYPVENKDGKLTLTGFFVLAQWQDCEIGEACILGNYGAFTERMTISNTLRFQLDNFSIRHSDPIYIYRRVQ